MWDPQGFLTNCTFRVLKYYIVKKSDISKTTPVNILMRGFFSKHVTVFNIF